jgi:lipopolysaccharide transport system permease protein
MDETSKNSPTISRLNKNSDIESHKPVDDLPDKPIIVIEARRRSLVVNLQDLWQYRDLFYVLTLRDIKVRYKQTVFGILWVIIQPLFMMIIFTVFFGRLAAIPSDGIPYPIFFYSGLLPWIFFSNSLNNSGNSLVGNSSLITKVYFPRMIIPIAAVGSGLIDFAVSFGLLAILMLYYGVGFSLNILMLPLLTLLTALLAIGVGLGMSALNVKYRDIRHALPFLIQVWMFATPIIYPASLIPEKWRWLSMINPLSGLIEAYRSAIFGKPFDLPSLAISIIIIFLLLIYSASTFRQMERSFADII